VRIVVKALNQTLAAADRTQRSHQITAVAYGVAKKFGDDNLNQFVAGWVGTASSAFTPCCSLS
jgi:hypothetical protein